MGKPMDFFMLAIGLIYVILGVRGYDLGCLANWKYYACILLGILFCVGAVMEDRRKKK